MKFLIVTPTFNRIDFLNDTITSVVSQSGDFEIEYRIQDGGSNQAMLEVLQYWKSSIDSGAFKPSCRKLTFDYSVEPDTGMYDAINRGFAKGSGDVMAWLNSDDRYLPNAFSAIASVFETYSEVDWIIGQSTACNKDGSTVAFGYSPRAYSRYFVEHGFYRSDSPPFSWLSQDSIFWRSSLWDKVGPLSTQYKLVSDFKLWQKFAEHTELVKLEALLGGYRFHGDQLTGDAKAYPAELDVIRKLPLRFRLLHKLCFRLRGFGRIACSNVMRPFARLVYSVPLSALFGRVITWDFENQSWKLEQSRILP